MPDFSKDFSEEARRDRIDRERGRAMGPRAGAEPGYVPGYRFGLNVVLSLDEGERRAAARLTRGITAVAGELVRVKQDVRITESSCEWIKPRVPGNTYFIYLGRDGTVYTDTSKPVWNVDDFLFAHPQYSDRAALGHVFVSFQGDIVFASPQITWDAVVVVSPTTDLRADYYTAAGSNDDQTVMNVAAKYLVQRFSGGNILLEPGQFHTSGPINLLGPFVQLQGRGRATQIFAAGSPTPWADDPDDVVSVVGQQEGSLGTQVRDLVITTGEKTRHYLGWGGTVGATEESGGRDFFVSPAPGKFPAIQVGPSQGVNTPASRTGTKRLVFEDQGGRQDNQGTSFDRLSLQRASGQDDDAGWINQLVLDAGGANFGNDATLRMIDFEGRVRVRLRANPRGGSLRFQGPAEFGTYESQGIIGGTPQQRRLGRSPRWDFSGDLVVVVNIEAGGAVRAGGDVTAAGDVVASGDVAADGEVRAPEVKVSDRVTTEWLQVNHRGLMQRDLYVYGDIYPSRSIRMRGSGGVSRSSSWSGFVRQVLSVIPNGATFMVSGSQQWYSSNSINRIGTDDFNVYHYARRLGSRVVVYGTQMRFPGLGDRRQRRLIQTFTTGSPTYGYLEICFMRIYQG